MKAACIAAVSRAAGREITLSESQRIESKVRAALRVLAMQDPKGFTAKSADRRLEEAAKLAAKWLDQDAENEARRVQVATAVHERVQQQMDTFAARGLDLQDGVDRLLFENADGRSQVMALETRIRATREDYQRRLVESVDALSPRAFGMFANREGSQAFVRELFGEKSGDELAAKAAKEWHDVAESMASHFEDAGGELHRLADWRYPQNHDQVKVYNAGLEDWVAFVRDKIDRRRYVNESGLLMDDAEIKLSLAEAWDSISTGGANGIEPGEREGVSSVAKRELAHRFLHFKDAQAYLDYQDRFGSRDVWSSLTAHVGRMARSIAMMEHFGPNADREFAFWNDYATLHSRHKKLDALGVADKLDNGYRMLAGYSEGVANSAVAKVFDDTRNILTAARLGSAILASIPDVATIAMTARYNHVSALSSLWNGLRLLNPAAGEQRRELERAGLMTNASLQAMSRFQVDFAGQSFSGRMANAILTASGLNAWTDGMRAGFTATQAHALAHLVNDHESIATLDPADAKILKAKGIDERTFAVWKLAGGEATSFGKLLTPDSIYRIPDAKLEAIAREATIASAPADALPGTTRAITPAQVRRDAAIQLLGVTMSESHMAVVEPGGKERMAMSTSLPRGDIKGELLRSFWQFKTFAWALVQKHMVQRGWNGADTAGGKAGYLVPLTIGTTLLGGLAMEIKDLVSGRDPRPLWGADPKVLTKNWISAWLAGGAMGMYGDFLGQAATEDSKSALASLMGPTAGLVYDAGNLAIGGSVRALNDVKQTPGQKAVQLAKGVLPGANLWYTKAATDHLLFNWMQDQLNPGYMARSAARSRANFGTTFWWAPNQASPARPPNPATAIGVKAS